MAITVPPMSAVAPQPAIARRGVARKRPIMFLCETISIIIAMIGTATTPLMTALQINMRMGSNEVKVRPKPIAVAAAMIV